MDRYPLRRAPKRSLFGLWGNRSSGRRRRRSKKWLYIISVLLIALAIKIFHGSKPASVFADADELDIFIANSETGSGKSLFAVRPAPEMNLREMPDTASQSNPELTALIDNVMACLDVKPSRITEARDSLNEMLSMSMSERQLAFVKKQLTALSEQWLFSRTVFPGDNLCGSYKVKPGDQFVNFAKRFNVPYEVLMQINNISNPRSLRAGETIKIINGPFHCRIYRSAFTMDLYLQDTYVRTFSVGLGRYGMETPTGRWLVKPGGKLISPTWTDPTTGQRYETEDPDYPLGARWIGLEGIDGEARDRTGFAVHGTKNAGEIGTAGSQGCIRLYNDDVVLLYNLLMPGVSQVVVVE